MYANAEVKRTADDIAEQMVNHVTFDMSLSETSIKELKIVTRQAILYIRGEIPNTKSFELNIKKHRAQHNLISDFTCHTHFSTKYGKKYFEISYYNDSLKGIYINGSACRTGKLGMLEVIPLITRQYLSRLPMPRTLKSILATEHFDAGWATFRET